MREPTPVFTNRLQCVECGRVPREDERVWTARLTVDDQVAVYCPECTSASLALERRPRRSTSPPSRRLDTTLAAS